MFARFLPSVFLFYESYAIVRNGSPRSPFPPGVDNPYEAESVALRRRNRELEHAVKSLKSQLNKRADLLKSYGEREKQAASSINVQYQQRLEQAEIEKIKALEQLRIELSGSAEEVAAKRARSGAGRIGGPPWRPCLLTPGRE